jgi:hypothetical protein
VLYNFGNWVEGFPYNEKSKLKFLNQTKYDKNQFLLKKIGD